jgi:hypothetical protein
MSAIAAFVALNAITLNRDRFTLAISVHSAESGFEQNHASQSFDPPFFLQKK